MVFDARNFCCNLRTGAVMGCVGIVEGIIVGKVDEILRTIPKKEWLVLNSQRQNRLRSGLATLTPFLLDFHAI